MWTSTLDLDFKRVLLTRLLGRFWSGAPFSSFAPLQVRQLPRQSLPASHWVRVRNRLAGICGSDLHLVYADGDLRTAPAALPHDNYLYPGHEVLGEVIEIGDDVQHLKVGDRVVLQYGPNCLASGLQDLCRSCSAGCFNLCENASLPSPTQIGGGWSEEMLLPEQQLFHVPDSLSDEQAVLLEPAAVAAHAALRHLPLANERVLIIGAGTIGLLTLQVLRALAPQSEISVLARHPFQVEQATRMGAAHIIYPQDSYVGIQRVTHAQIHRGFPGNQTLVGGYDAIFDTVGKRKTLHHALRWAQTRATVILVGIDLHQMQIDLTPIWHQELNLLGVHAHGLENWPLGTQDQASSFSVALELMEQGYLHPELLITHHYALTNYQNALLTASTKTQSRAIKVLFDYSLLPPSVVTNVRASARRRRPNPTSDLPEDLTNSSFSAEEDLLSDESEEPQSVPTPQSSAEPSIVELSLPTPHPYTQPTKFAAKPASSTTPPRFSPTPPVEEEEESEAPSPSRDPHALPTLREEAFLAQAPQDDWSLEPSSDYEASPSFSEDDFDQSPDEARGSNNSLSSAHNARYDQSRNRSRSQKKNNRR